MSSYACVLAEGVVQKSTSQTRSVTGLVYS